MIQCVVNPRCGITGIGKLNIERLRANAPLHGHHDRSQRRLVRLPCIRFPWRRLRKINNIAIFITSYRRVTRDIALKHERILRQRLVRPRQHHSIVVCRQRKTCMNVESRWKSILVAEILINGCILLFRQLPPEHDELRNLAIKIQFTCPAETNRH